jgi:hypothetical protein
MNVNDCTWGSTSILICNSAPAEPRSKDFI